MIVVTNAPGGLLLRRDTDPDDAALFVKTEELGQLLTAMLETVEQLPIEAAWDCMAYLAGNEQAAA